MKRRHMAWIVGVAIAGVPLTVYGWSSSLSAPSIAPGPDASAGGIEAALAALDEAEFTEGSFVNEDQSMSFAGTAESINAVVRSLTADADLDVTVSFAHFKETEVSFRFHQNAVTRESAIVVNLNHPDLDLSKLRFVVGSQHVPNAVEATASSGEVR